MSGLLARRFQALRQALLLALLALLPAVSMASACTAMWGILLDGTGANPRLGYYNNSAGTAAKWNTLTFTLTGSPNALAGDSTSGLLYYFDRAGLHLHQVDLNANTDTDLGTVPNSPAGSGNANMIGATTDSAGNLFLMASSGGGNAQYYVAQVTKSSAVVTVTSWIQVTYLAGGAQPFSGGSGDLVQTPGGQVYLATNTNPSAIYPLTLSTAKVGPSVTYAIGSLTLAGIGVNPLDNNIYIGSNNTGSITYRVNPAVNNSQVLVDASPSTLYQINDMGNCIVPPNPPTVSKSFNPVYSPASGATTTLQIAIANANTVPTWLTSPFVDTLPAGMTIAATPNLSAGACSTTTNTITAPAGGSAVTFASGGRIPAGGCTITLSVTAAAAAASYTNVIAAGAIVTTSGTNAAGATATYKVGTDFRAEKSQRLGTAGATTTSSITVPGGATLQYELSITNSTGGGTGSVTFTDTLPVQITPMITVTAVIVAGGSGTCTVSFAPVGGSTQLTGTVTNATAGTQCVVAVTARAGALSAVTNITNTLTIAPIAGSTSDTNGTNNTSTVPATLGASANIAVSKTNNVNTLAAGQTTLYTVTVANYGPAAAPGTTVVDPASPGLSCTTVSCTSTVANMCPASPFPFGNMTSGVQITPTFAMNSTASFVISCGVVATVLP